MTIEDQPSNNDAMQQTNRKHAKGWQTRVEGGTAYIAETIHFSSGDAGGGRQVESIDFQPYLRSILDNEDYREWQEVYTLTTVEDRKQSHRINQAESPQTKVSCRLKLRVETVKPPESEHQRTEATDRQEQVEQLDVLAGLRKYAPEHVLLVGKPGSGKSTSLERLLWEEADQALKQTANAKIPVLVKLRRCTGTIEALIQDFCRSHQLPLTIADIETLLDQGKLLLLLDGLNELPEAFRTNVANFRDRYRATTPMIVSTREQSIGGNLGIAKTLKMLPLTEPQMQEFVRGYLGQKGNRLWQQLKGDRLRKFAETPLLLWMLCRVFAENNRVPANLGLAFREFTQLYNAEIQQDAPVASREQWSKLLRHLAFALMHDREPTAFRLSMSREEAADRLTTCLQQEGRANARDCAERGLKDLLSYHLIQPVMQPNYEEHIEFRHQLIQEYYAAEYLLRTLPTLSDEQLKRDYLNYLKWTEPLALMLALVDEEAQALRVVRLAIDDVDLMLGAKLAGSVRDNSQPQTIDLLRQLPLLPELQTDCLAETGSDASIPALLQSLEDQVFETRLSAIHALGKLGSKATTPGLLKALKDESLDIRDTAADVLSGLDPLISIPLSLELLEDEDPSLRQIASEVLGELNYLEAQPKLLEELEDQDSDVRASAAIALGKMGCTASIPHLLELLHPPYSYLTWTAAELLGELGIESAIPSLTEALNDQDKYVRIRAAQSLGKYNNEASVLGLLDALEDQEFGVIMDAKGSLLKLKEISIPVLFNLLESESPNNRKRAIDALGEIGDEIAIPRLIKALEDEEWAVRIRAANTLIKIKSNSAVPDLVRLLKHQNPSVRSLTAHALGMIGSQDATLALIQAFLDQSQDLFAWISIVIALGRLGHDFATLLLPVVADWELPLFLRADIVEALGEMRNKVTEPEFLPHLSKAAIPILVLALKDESTYVRGQAAVALGKLGNSDTVPKLVESLADDDKFVRRSIADSLGKIGSETAIPSLLELLKDEDWVVRSSALDALETLGGEKVIQGLLEILESEEWYIQKDSIDLLGKLGCKAVIPKLLNILTNEDILGDGAWEVCSSAIDTLAKMGTPEDLAVLWDIYLKKPEFNFTQAIYSIQNRYQFYNYEIWQETIQNEAQVAQLEQNDLPLSAKLLDRIDQTTQQIDRRTQQMANEPKNNFTGATFHAPVNFGDNPTGDFIGTQNNYASDPEVQGAIADLQTLLTQLQSQHPQVTTETEALTILDAEFTEIKQSKTHRLATLRKQLLNPERHLQATKAALGEVAKHYLEESVWAKTLLTYVDKLSEEPNHGA